MRGLDSTLPALLATAPSTDVFLLTETWCESEESAPELDGFECICVSRPWKHFASSRSSGGSACYVKNHLAAHVKRWKASPDASLLWLQLDTALGFDRDLYLCLTYIWPEASTHYHHPLAIDAFDALTEDVAEIYNMDGHVLLSGDFNARTANNDDFVHRDVYDALLPEEVPRYLPLPDNIAKRQSCDDNCNAFGHRLLQLCQDANLLILNGRTSGDESGKLTCHTGAGHSAVDYFIASPLLLKNDRNLHVRDLMPESDHCPLTLAIGRQVMGLHASTPQPFHR